MRRRHLFIVAAALAAAFPSAAGAQVPLEGRTFAVSQENAGRLDMFFSGVQGSVVAFAEIEGGRPRQLGTVAADGRGIAVQLGAERWSCDRVVRRFAAAASAPGEAEPTFHEFDIRTPSCANRVAIHVPRRARRGEIVDVRLVDRWRLGVPVQLCVSGARVNTRRRCRLVDVPGTSRGMTKRFRVRRDGQLRVAVEVAGHRVAEYVAVGSARLRPRKRGPLVLLTGDSTSQGLDGVLADVLGSAARVRGDSHPGRGISTPGRKRWATLARSQVKKRRPDVTVVTVGANDGYRFPGGEDGIACCGAAWTAEYTRRVRGLMTIYARKGRGRVLWLTLPIPRDPRRARFTRAINTAVRAAADGRKHVRLLDLHALFTPDGAYREKIAYRGDVVKVRADDGIHLSADGAEIAGVAIADALERARWLDDVD